MIEEVYAPLTACQVGGAAALAQALRYNRTIRVLDPYMVEHGFHSLDEVHPDVDVAVAGVDGIMEALPRLQRENEARSLRRRLGAVDSLLQQTAMGFFEGALKCEATA